MNLHRLSILPALLLVAALTATPALAKQAKSGHSHRAPMEAMGEDYHTTPLIVIRFNQRKVYYEQPLYEAVSQAAAAKAAVRFDIVSLIPAGGSEESAAKAERNLANVVHTMNDMGVPGRRLNISRRFEPVEANEIQVFVR